jgi:hypothetical protein
MSKDLGEPHDRVHSEVSMSTTSNEVVTAIETDRPKLARMRDLKVFVLCPSCPAGHRIPANTMYFGAQPLPPPAQDGRQT